MIDYFSVVIDLVTEKSPCMLGQMSIEEGGIYHNIEFRDLLVN